jgi:hypothetical protein
MKSQVKSWWRITAHTKPSSGSANWREEISEIPMCREFATRKKTRVANSPRE